MYLQASITNNYSFFLTASNRATRAYFSVNVQKYVAESIYLSVFLCSLLMLAVPVVLANNCTRALSPMEESYETYRFTPRTVCTIYDSSNNVRHIPCLSTPREHLYRFNYEVSTSIITSVSCNKHNNNRL